jgi:ubiquinone/menaquinone biosynthesis C-methylase UbiE
MDKNYYLEYYHLERSNWWFRVREKIIEDQLQKHLSDIHAGASLTILNVGAATGRSSEVLGKYGKVTSIEYDADCCAFTREKTNLSILNASVLELPFADNSFDLVCAFDVIEHVEDDQLAVREMQRVCKKDGVVYITVPAFQQLWSHHDVVNQHFRRYKMNQIVSLFGSQGRILKKTYFNSILFLPILSFRTISRLFPKAFTRSGSGSDFSFFESESLTNRILYQVFHVEKYLLRLMRFSAGVSILFMWKQQK